MPMSPPPPHLFLLYLFSIIHFSILITGIPDPDPVEIQTLKPSPIPTSTATATIPAFPEQSDVAGCPLDIPDELFHSVKSACGGGVRRGELHRSRCCPVLGAWLYAAYSSTALRRVAPAEVSNHSSTGTATGGASYDMPVLPDDSETCVDGVSRGLRERGIELAKPNETCDVVSCYCGIRLHPWSCPDSFFVNQKGKLVGDKRVKRVERDCLSSSKNANGFPGLGGCSTCLKSLYSLSSKKASNPSKSDQDRTTKMHNKDCHLMGLTWLLAKNRTAYIHTVSAVLRATMMTKDGSDPQSCTLNSDGMPLAVDSSEISTNSASLLLTPHQPPLTIASFVCLLHLLLIVPSLLKYCYF